MRGDILIIVIRKKYIYVVIVTLLILSIGVTLNSNKIKVTFKHMVKKVIIIDAGHGGVDGGAVSKLGNLESHINLEIALRLRELLEEQGIIVILTRDEDRGLYSDSGSLRNKKNEDLRNRREIMNNSDADAFVSIHMNAYRSDKCHGSQTFYPRRSEESKILATKIQNQLIKIVDTNNHRKAGSKNDVYLLKDCKIPMALVECGFLSNPQEEQRFLNEKHQEKVAWAIFIGIMEYLEEI